MIRAVLGGRWRGAAGIWAMFSALVLCSPAWADGRLLIFAYGDHNEAPYAYVQNGQLAGGFAREFGEALAAKLDREAAFRFVPRNRIPAELTAGSVDLYCIATPTYYPTFGTDRFSHSLFVDEDIILLSKKLTGPPTPDILVGAQVGTVLGYHYPPAVETLFRNGRAERIDARNAETNLRKLAGGRLDAVIMPHFGWNHAQQANPALRGLVRDDYIVISRSSRSCLVSPASDVTVAEVDAAIDALTGEGTMSSLLAILGISSLLPSDYDGAWKARTITAR